MISILDKLEVIQEYVSKAWSLKTFVVDSIFSGMITANVWLGIKELGIFEGSLKTPGSLVWVIVWGLFSVSMASIRIYMMFLKAKRIKIENKREELKMFREEFQVEQEKLQIKIMKDVGRAEVEKINKETELTQKAVNQYTENGI